MRSRRLVLPASCLLTGVLIGLGLDMESAQTHPAPLNVSSASLQATAQCPPHAQESRAAAHTRQLSLEDIRTVIREELGTQLAALPRQPDEFRPKAPPADPHTEEQQRLHYDRASQLVRGAISFGTWTQENRQQLRSVLHELSVPQQDQLIGELFGAIQSGRLRAENSGPPL